MKFPGLKYLSIFVVFLLQISLFAETEIPKPSGMVNDYKGLLSTQERQNLETKLRNYRDSTSTEIAIVIETKLQGTDDEFTRARAIAKEWGLGQKDKNNGVILYIAFEDKKTALLTANKTQGAVVDHEAKRILIDVLKPNFRAGKYYEGIDQSIDQLILQLRGEFKGSPNDKKDSLWPFVIAIIVIVILILIFSKGNGANRGYRGGGMYWFPTNNWGNWDNNSGGGGGGSSWGGFGGGGGFDGGGATGDW